MSLVERIWYRRNPAAILLLPLSALFALATGLRRFAYRIGLMRTERFNVPVIVVGNITAGGTGKTPLVIWLIDHLRGWGLNPGIVSRGYGGRARNWPQQVRADSDPVAVGDEAVMLAARTGSPMCVGPDRPAAVRALLAHTDVDVVVCDDGLQHYALGRDLELAVIDGQRRFGNGLLLPAGPLREPRSRLAHVDLVIANGQPAPGEHAMQTTLTGIRALGGDADMGLTGLAGLKVHAVAGVGNPERFFALLERHGLLVLRHAYPDHHAFVVEDLTFDDDLPVLMTEKDAVKCQRLPCRNCWVVRIEARPDERFVSRFAKLLKEVTDG